MTAAKSAGSSDQMAPTSASAIDNISNSNVNLLPFSCKYFSNNCHTLNGICLLYERNFKKVSTAFCDFKNNQGIECSPYFQRLAI